MYINDELLPFMTY